MDRNNTALKILDILEENEGEAISGEKIASLVGITRSAVWKQINRLKSSGYHIISTGNRGYALAKDNDLFTAKSVKQALEKEGESCQTHFSVEVREEVASTNSLLKEAARMGAPEGKILIAKRQTGGRGRLGRSFFSPKKGIYLSFLLRPKIPFGEALFLTTIAAVAVTEAVKEVTGIEVGIKWVNDIYMGNKKICGILTEAEADVENGMLSFAVVGLGLNLTEPEEGLPDELKEIAGFLYGKEDSPKGIMTKLTAVILRRYFFYYEQLPEHTFLNVYREQQILTGKEIYVISAEEKKRALVRGVDEEARLLVTYEDGKEEVLFTGEVSVREVSEASKNPPRFFTSGKPLILIIFLLFLPFFYGCETNGVRNSENNSIMEERKEKGYTFIALGESFDIHEDIDEKIKKLSKPNSTYEAPSCADLGEDIIYTYSGFSLSATKDEDTKGEILYSILLLDDSVSTEEGLFIGDDEKRVKDIYGDTELKQGVYHYPKGKMELLIVMKDREVVSIEYRSLEK